MSEPTLSAGRRPHVVIILCDQLRADALGFYGNPYVRTPNLDRLAAAGAVFDNLIVQTPVCMGSRACLLTGRYLRANRMAGGAPLLDPQFHTIATTLQRAGYRTGTFGKLHLTPQQYTLETLKSDRPVNDAGPFLAPCGLEPRVDDPTCRNYGFEHSVGCEDILRGEWVQWVAQRDPALAGKIISAAGRACPTWQSEFPGTALADVGVQHIPAELHPSSFITQTASDFFREQHRLGPCLLHVSFVDPHHPFDPPAELARRYAIDDIPLPRYRDTGDLVWPASVRQRWVNFDNVSDHHARTTIAYYWAMVDMIDQALGQLLRTIEQAGEMENTLFLFMSDHGEFLGDYGRWRKGATHYDCLIRVPGFIAQPGVIPGGRRIPGLLQEIDMAPTLLSLAGLQPTPAMQGLDFASALREEKPIGRPWAFCESYLAHWGPFVNCWTVRTPTAQLNWYPTDRAGHLFDLATDPDQRHDRMADPDRSSLRQEMNDVLLEALHAQTDPLPTMVTQY